MDTKIIAAALAVCLIAFAGMAYAFPGFYNGMMGNKQGNMNANAHQRGGAGNWQGAPNASSYQNATAVQERQFQQATADQIAQFKQAIANDDWATAQSLHSTYGLGGPLFNRMNQTTFDQYSKIYTLSQQLTQSTGMPTMRANATIVKQFNQAIANDDWATAQSLHETYGLGGMLFDKLTQVTFGQYSQLYNLRVQFNQAMGGMANGKGMKGFDSGANANGLGMGANNNGAMPWLNGFNSGYKTGFARGMHNGKIGQAPSSQSPPAVPSEAAD